MFHLQEGDAPIRYAKKVDALDIDTEKYLKKRLKIWGFKGRWSKDVWGHVIVVENKVLLRRCKEVLEITSSKEWFPYARVKIGSVHGKYAFGIGLMGRTGGGWGSGYNPSLGDTPYDTCKEAKRAGIEHCIASLKSRLESKYDTAHPLDTKLLRLLEEELGPQQMELF